MFFLRRGLLRCGRLTGTNVMLPQRTMMTSNPFLDQDGLPRFESMRAPEVITKYLGAAVTSSLEEMEEKFSVLEDNIRAKDIVAAPVIMDELERVSAKLSYVWGVAGHLNMVRAR